MGKYVIGIVAHVDAGKTTLSEALLYKSGAIRNLGRVDSKNAFLDNNSIERERGITIFSKQAQLSTEITLIDTPGHVDFSAEMERSLSILDMAILLINASDGVQSYTKTLFSLLHRHNIPVIIFVNKMDMGHTSKEAVQVQLRERLTENICDFDLFASENFYTKELFESVAETDEKLLEKYFAENKLDKEDILKAIINKDIYPVIFGSALKLEKIDTLLNIVTAVSSIEKNEKRANENFSCIIYKISKDKQNNRLTHIKVKSGSIKVKDIINGEKINEIRRYSGDKYEMLEEVHAGDVCTLVGLKKTRAATSSLEAALEYSVIPNEKIDSASLLTALKEIEDEFPELQVDYNEATHEICVKLMGEVQTEVIKRLVKDRYNMDINLGEGRIAYKETIAESVVGVGHYEPLKHYAEVHLQLSPLPRASGMHFESNLSVDELDTNWQRLILTHLKEKAHKGVLTGSPLTDIEIKVIAGKAHLKHTEGGDFRQSTYRAIRQALMHAKSVLLEPIYSYEIVVPENCTGRVMSDMERKKGDFNLVENKAGFSVITGKVPVSEMKNYVNELRSYTKGQGSLTLVLSGYDLCHNEKEVIEKIGYNADADKENPSCSVFCSHGAGFVVPWDKVDEYKHIK